jgi:hypothetical protein
MHKLLGQSTHELNQSNDPSQRLAKTRTNLYRFLQSAALGLLCLDHLFCTIHEKWVAGIATLNVN